MTKEQVELVKKEISFLVSLITSLNVIITSLLCTIAVKLEGYFLHKNNFEEL